MSGLNWRRLLGAEAPPVKLPHGARILAWATSDRGAIVAGTREDLVVIDGGGAQLKVGWHEIESAEWDEDSETLVVTEVGRWGQPRVTHRWALIEASRLLVLIRERVTASVVHQRHVRVTGRRGLRVVARRPLNRDSEVAWFFEYDEGVDPDDPAVAALAREALAQARDDVGR